MVLLDSILAEKLAIGAITGLMMSIIISIVYGISGLINKSKQKKKHWVEVNTNIEEAPVYRPEPERHPIDQNDFEIQHKEDCQQTNQEVNEADKPFVLPDPIEYFFILSRLDMAKHEGTVRTKEEEADFLCKLMEEEDMLIEEGKLCPKCHALNTVRNHYCHACKQLTL